MNQAGTYTNWRNSRQWLAGIQITCSHNIAFQYQIKGTGGLQQTPLRTPFSTAIA
jgi:hypothetical protein